MKSLTFQALLLLLLQATFSLAETTITVIERPSFTTTLAASTTPKTTPLLTASSTLQTSTIPASSSRRAGYVPASTVPNSGDGSEGSDKSSYSLSTGGLIAVIVVVVAVAIFGIVSIILYVLAKRRNWQVRASIKRASRRLTGRKDPTRGAAATKRKRSGGVMGERKPGTTIARPPGQKHGVAVEIKDVEKGAAGGGEKEKKSENKWVQRLWGNDWK